MSFMVPGKPDIARVVLVRNHTAESYKLARQCEEELRGSRLGKPVISLMTRPGGVPPNTEMLANVLEEGDIVGTICGDGTFRDIALSVGDTPVTSLRGGNARDIGWALHKRPNKTPPSKLIQQSVAISAFALACTIQGEGLTQREHAVSYIGCGETARASAHLATDKYRNQQNGLCRDLGVGVRSLRSSFAFDIVDNRGDEQRLSDLTFAKGSRMAKRFRIPVHHWDEEFLAIPIDEGIVPKCVAAGGLALGLVSGTRHEEYSFIAKTEFDMHFDGDPPRAVQPESIITVGMGEQYTLLTSRLR